MVLDTGILVNKLSISKNHEQFIGIRNIFKARSKGVGAIYVIIMSRENWY